jgi:SAM-dependent methyltransferase
MNLGEVERLYRDSLAEHGASPCGVGWKDEAAQTLRFEKLAYVLDADGPVSVIDWGCGYGAMFAFLDARVELARYTGYDISAEMLAAARANVPDERARFVHGTRIEEDADYAFLSGTLNVRMSAPEAEWAAYVRDVLRMLHARSRRGFAFNLLTSYVDWREDHLYYADPGELFAFCRTELARSVTLLHDYPLYEWTIAVRRDQPSRT